MNKKTLAGVFGAFAAAVAALLATQHGGPRPTPPPPLAEWTATCRTVMLERRARAIAADELAGCIDVARRGGHVEQGAANDPTHLNRNWPKNVLKLWLGRDA